MPTTRLTAPCFSQQLHATRISMCRFTIRFLAHSGKVTSIISEGHESGNSTIIGSYPRIVTGGADRVVALWDPRLRQPCVFKFKGHTDTVNCLLLDSSRACVVSGGRDQTVKIWDVRTGRQRTSQNEHFGSVNCLTICKQKNSEGGGSYLSSGRDGVVCVWKRGSGELNRSLRQGPNAKGVTCLSVKSGEGSDGGSRSIAGGADGQVRLWDHNRGKCLRVMKGGHVGAVNSVVWTHGKGKLVSGGNDGSLRFWDARAGKCTQWIQAHSGGVTGLCYLTTNGGGGMVASSSKDGTVRVVKIA